MPRVLRQPDDNTMTNDYVTSEQFEKFLQQRREEHRRNDKAAGERGKEIKEMLRKQDTMQTSMDSISKWRLNIDKIVGDHDHALFGNGEPGMDEVLRNINKWISEQKEQGAKTKQLDKEITLLGIKTTAETKLAIIQGFISLTGIVLTAWLVGGE